MISNKTTTAVTVAQFIAERIAVVGKTAQDLVSECGLVNYRMATMILNGHAKVPLRKLDQLARTLDIPREELRARILGEYFPELVPAVSPAGDEAAPHTSPISGEIPFDERECVTSTAIVRMPEDRQVLSARDCLHIPSLRIRLLFRALPNGFTTREAAQHLMLGTREAEWLLQELASLDYVIRANSDNQADAPWGLLPDGQRLADAEVPTPLLKPAAMQVVAQFLEQVAQVNRQADLAYRVAGVNIIGELVATSAWEEVPHVELVVIVAHKSDDPAGQRTLMAASMERCRAEVVAQGHLDWKPTERSVRLDFQGLLRNCGLPVALRWFYDPPEPAGRA